MIFLDGVGIGQKDYQSNPFFKFGSKMFENIFGEIPSIEKSKLERNGIYLFPSDARMGISGLPQSGTGQVSIFCGINAPEFVGKHFGPFPYSTTIPIIAENNILKYFKDENKIAYFANAYPKVFFEYINSGKSRLNTTALCCKLSDIRLNTVDEVINEKALTAEITNERWNKRLNYNLKEIRPGEGARRLINIALQNDFTLYEYFLTDHLGHGRIQDEFDSIYNTIDEFLFAILNEINSDKMTLIICSDHGNFEDLSVKTHTLNPALTITAGINAREIAETIIDLSDIKPSIIKYCT